jgi:hypothetical protein
LVNPAFPSNTTFGPNECEWSVPVGCRRSVFAPQGIDTTTPAGNGGARIYHVPGGA